MANVNKTYTLSESELLSLVPKFVTYAIQGSLITIGNLPIFLAILRYNLLREKKEYLVLSALVFIDLLYGIGYIVAGIGRNLLILQGKANDLVTGWQCVWAPWNFFFLITGHVHGPVLMAVSVDRLLMVMCPLQYIGWGRRYVAGLLTCILGPFLVPLVMLLVYISHERDTLSADKPAICYTTWIYNVNRYHYIVLAAKTTASWLSILLYVVIVMKIGIQRTQTAPTLSVSEAQSEMKRQRKLTITMGLSCACTFIFWIMPKHLNHLLMWADSDNQLVAAVTPLLAIAAGFNPMLNAVLYLKRHRDIRMVVWCMIRCKKPTRAMLETKVRPLVENRERNGVNLGISRRASRPAWASIAENKPNLGISKTINTNKLASSGNNRKSTYMAECVV